MTALISSMVVSRPDVKVRSINETFGVGTRTEEPSNLPFNSGSTSPTAFAAPVDAGISDTAAARARRRMQGVERRLITGIGMDRRHEPFFNADRFVQNIGNRRQTVGGT